MYFNMIIYFSIKFIEIHLIISNFTFIIKILLYPMYYYMINNISIKFIVICFYN